MDELQEARNRVTELEGKVTTLTESNSTLTTENAGLKAENAQLKEGQLLAKARAIVEAAVGAAKLPDVTKKRLTEGLAANPPLGEDAQIDEAAFTERITAAIDEASAEVAAIAGSPVTGMGGAPSGDAAGRSALKESAKRRYLSEGKSEDEAERLATIFANGR